MKNNTTTIDIEISPEAKKLVKESEGMLEIYRDYKIISAPAYTLASEDLKKIKTKSQQIDELRRSITRPLDEAKSRIMDFFRQPLEFLTKAEAIIKKAMLTFQQDQEKKRQEEEARLQELAHKEEERKRKQLEAQAVKAEAKGDAEKAEELREKAEEVHIPVPIVPDQTPKVQGISTRTIWKYRIININKLPREYMMPNDKLLSEFSEATKGKIPIEGVEFYSEEILSSTTK